MPVFDAVKAGKKCLTSGMIAGTQVRVIAEPSSAMDQLQISTTCPAKMVSLLGSAAHGMMTHKWGLPICLICGGMVDERHWQLMCREINKIRSKDFHGERT
jgi:hypothetical protein